MFTPSDPDTVAVSYLRNWPISQARDLNYPPKPPLDCPLALATYERWIEAHRERCANPRTLMATTLAHLERDNS